MKKIVDVAKETDTYIHLRIAREKVYQDAVMQLKQELMAAGGEGPKHIIVDLSAVSAMNSAGLGILILLRETKEKAGARVIVYGLSEVMAQLFEQMKLGNLFSITADEESAVAVACK